MLIAMDTGIRVGDCIKSRLVTIDAGASVFEAARSMSAGKVGSLLVVKNGRISGIVTKTDLVRKCLALKKLNGPIERVASKPLLRVQADADLAEAARKMGSKDVKRLVVVKGGKIIGLISASDIVRISPSLYDLIAEKAALA